MTQFHRGFNYPSTALTSVRIILQIIQQSAKVGFIPRPEYHDFIRPFIFYHYCHFVAELHGISKQLLADCDRGLSAIFGVGGLRDGHHRETRIRQPPLDNCESTYLLIRPNLDYPYQFFDQFQSKSSFFQISQSFVWIQALTGDYFSRNTRPPVGLKTSATPISKITVVKSQISLPPQTEAD